MIPTRYKLYFAAVLCIPAIEAFAGLEGCLQEAPPEVTISNCSKFIEEPSGSNNDLVLAYFSRGLAFREIGDKQRAIEDLDQAVELQPEDGKLREYRLQVLAGFGEYEAALSDLDWFINRFEGNYPAYVSRCHAKTELGDFWGAVSDCEEALRIEPDFALTYNNMALALYRIGAHQIALNDIEIALSVDRENWASLDTKAHILVAVGETEEALATFKSVIELGGEEPINLYRKALREKGYYTEPSDIVSIDAMYEAISDCVSEGCGLLAEAGQLPSFETADDGGIKSQLLDSTYLCFAQAGLAEDSVFLSSETTKTLIAPDGSTVTVVQDSVGKSRVIARDARGLFAESATDKARSAVASCG